VENLGPLLTNGAGIPFYMIFSIKKIANKNEEFAKGGKLMCGGAAAYVRCISQY